MNKTTQAKVIGVSLAVYALLLGIAWIAMLANPDYNIFKVVLYAEILYSLSSLRTIDAKELGALLLFGRPIEELRAGLVFAPWLICSVVKTTALVIQDQYPGDPEKVDKTGDSVVAEGKVPPIRVTHAAPKSETSDPINRRMTTEVSIISRVQIKRGHYITFLTTIGSVNEMRRQIRDTVEGAVKKEFALRTPSETLKDLVDIDQILKSKVVKLTKDWGIKVDDVQIIDLDLGKTVNEALRDVPAARLKKEKKITEAEAEEERLTREGRGKASAEKDLLTARAEGEKLLLEAQAIGAKKLAEVAGTTEGQVVLWLDMMRTGFEKSQHTIIPGGELFSAVAGINAILEKTKTTKGGTT